MSILGWALVALAFVAYIPVVLTVTYGARREVRRRRPIDEVLADAYADGRVSLERFEEMIDDVHASLPSLDSPYPRVRER